MRLQNGLRSYPLGQTCGQDTPRPRIQAGPGQNVPSPPPHPPAGPGQDLPPVNKGEWNITFHRTTYVVGKMKCYMHIKTDSTEQPVSAKRFVTEFVVYL